MTQGVKTCESPVQFFCRTCRVERPKELEGYDGRPMKAQTPPIRVLELLWSKHLPARIYIAWSSIWLKSITSSTEKVDLPPMRITAVCVYTDLCSIASFVGRSQVVLYLFFSIDNPFVDYPRKLYCHDL